MKRIVIFTVLSCFVSISIMSSFPFVKVGSAGKPSAGSTQTSLAYNTDVLERLLKISRSAATYSAGKLDLLGVKEFTDIHAAANEGRFHMQITDTEGNNYFFTMDSYGYLGQVRAEDEYGEYLWFVLE